MVKDREREREGRTRRGGEGRGEGEVRKGNNPRGWRGSRWSHKREDRGLSIREGVARGIFRGI